MEVLCPMSTIHEAIRLARTRLGWSMKRLADEVANAEGKKPGRLSWQTVQQWENGTSAPKRTRMATVRAVLGISTPDDEMSAAPARVREPRPPPHITTEEPSQWRLALAGHLQALAHHLRDELPATREAVAALVASICRQPEHVTLHIAQIIGLLGSSGKIEAQKSTNSRSSANV